LDELLTAKDTNSKAAHANDTSVHSPEVEAALCADFL
jgi:hypothetical protein